MNEQKQPPVLPWDAHNQKLVSEVHPTDWKNPTPASRYNLVVIGGGTSSLPPKYPCPQIHLGKETLPYHGPGRERRTGAIQNSSKMAPDHIFDGRSFESRPNPEIAICGKPGFEGKDETGLPHSKRFATPPRYRTSARFWSASAPAVLFRHSPPEVIRSAHNSEVRPQPSRLSKTLSKTLLSTSGFCL